MPTHKDAILIAYPDQVSKEGENSLATLSDFLKRYAQRAISAVHILPFFPSTSDDGYSIADYREVDPGYGDWNVILELGSSFRLMFDAVINHTSASHPWFAGYLNGKPEFDRFYIAIEGDPDLSKVVRPRSLPVFTAFKSHQGEIRVWTTFSADQVDLNYGNPNVLIEILELIMFYISQGASLIRLDAVAYLWKEIGTDCINRPQTYHVVEVIRQMLEELAPGVQLITETNVPHMQNISYFGDGTNMSHMVYNFALPPMILHTFQSGSCEAMNRWATGLNLPVGKVTFLNFLASHDGIGLNSVRNILSAGQIEQLVERIMSLGGLVSNKTDEHGNPVPYELNINYFDAFGGPDLDESQDLQIKKFVCAHAILLSLKGLPGIYFHSMFGSQGWLDGVKLTGRNRTINRQKLNVEELVKELETSGSLRSRIHQHLITLLSARASEPAFDPYGGQEVVNVSESVFVLIRQTGRSPKKVLCLHNITGLKQSINMQEKIAGLGHKHTTDIITKREIELEPTGDLELAPYQVYWLV